MSTNSRGQSSQFDFEELANLMLEQGVAASPADLHGCMVGLLAAGESLQGESALAALHQALDLDLHGELAEQAIALYVSTSAALADEDFEFYPLLLDDDAPLANRTEALAAWCRSFLAGYAHRSAAPAHQESTLTGDSSEILVDIAAIAEADSENTEDDEESERAYAELTEYIRFAALNAYADRSLGPGGHAEDDSPVTPVH